MTLTYIFNTYFLYILNLLWILTIFMIFFKHFNTQLTFH